MIPDNERFWNWDQHIRLFAQYFLQHVQLPKQPFTFLDAGCGTGSALDEISIRYPYGQYFGCDLEPLHVQISQELNGQKGSFFVSQLNEVNSDYDIIYVSNVLEHLKGWVEAVENLALHCRRLYILVPYKEQLVPSTDPDGGVGHVIRFDSSSFDFLSNAKVFKLTRRVIRTPGAWGASFKREMFEKAMSILKGKMSPLKRELLIAVDSPEALELPTPFKPRIESFFARQR